MLSSEKVAQSLYLLAREGEKSDKVVKNLVAYLSQHKGLPLLPSIIARLERMAKRDGAHETLFIKTAHQLDRSSGTSIKEALGAKDAQTVTDQDDALLGGFVAEYQGVVYDASVRTQLEKLKQTLMS